MIENGFFISDVFLGYRQVPHFVIAVASTDRNPPWVIRATIDSNIFNDLVKNVRIGKTGEAYLLDAKGVFQTRKSSRDARVDCEHCSEVEHLTVGQRAERTKLLVQSVTTVLVTPEM